MRQKLMNYRHHAKPRRHAYLRSAPGSARHAVFEPKLGHFPKHIGRGDIRNILTGEGRILEALDGCEAWRDLRMELLPIQAAGATKTSCPCWLRLPRRVT